MNLHSIPALMMAAVTFYVGLFHLLICLRQAQRRHHFLFALTCLTVGVYDVFCAGLYSAQSTAEGAAWQRGQIPLLALAGLTFLWFVFNYTRHPRARGFRVLAILYGCLAVALYAAPRDWVVRADQPAVRTVRIPLLGESVYREVALGPLALVLSAATLAAFAYLFRIVAAAYRRGEGRRMGPLLLSLVVFLLAVLNDTAVAAGLYSFMYLFEYAFMGIVLFMALFLTAEVADLIVAGEHLRAVEQRFGAIFRNTAVGIALADRGGGLIAANAAMCAMLGREAAAVRGLRLLDCLHPADAAQLRPVIGAILRGELDTIREERRYVQPDGTPYWGDMSFACVRQPVASAEALVWINVGITDRRRSAEALRALTDALEQKVANRTAELEEANRRLSQSLSLLRADEEAGRMIQFNLLPPEERDIGGVRFSRFLAPSLYLSGDFVDYFEIDAGHIGFYLADVSGHGVSSAFVTILLQSLIGEARQRRDSDGTLVSLDPARLLHHLNDELVRRRAGKHVSLLYGVLCQDPPRIVLGSAGHYPPPLLRAGGSVDAIPGKGTPLGLFETSVYRNVERPLPAEFGFVAFSDGILDVLPARGIGDKQEALRAAVGDGPLVARAISDRIGVDKMSSLPDDVTILAIERRGGIDGR